MSSVSNAVPSVELTDSQTKTLQLLIDCYRERGTPVKIGTVVKTGKQDPTTIRSQLRNLKALQLVKGISGPRGGYKPTRDAYRVLDLQMMDKSVLVPITRNGERVEGVNVQEIDLISVHHPEKCHTEVYFQGSALEFQDGDTVTVGPTPTSGLTITGQIDGIADDGPLTVDIESMNAPAGNKGEQE